MALGLRQRFEYYYYYYYTEKATQSRLDGDTVSTDEATVQQLDNGRTKPQKYLVFVDEAQESYVGSSSK